jgi:hypothetical protein
MKRNTYALVLLLALTAAGAHAKTFQNSYVSFDVPDDWTCVQEGVAWTCNPRGAVESKEAVIVLASKVAGPEDNLGTFLNFLKQPKKIVTKVGTPMPSQVMYAQQRQLGGHPWIQAQHLGSEIQEYYTLYLATVKEQLAILISFSAERTRYKTYNPIFEKAIRTLKITANQQLLFPKNTQTANEGAIGIQGPAGQMAVEDMMPPPEHRANGRTVIMVLLGLGLAIAAAAAYTFKTKRKKISHGKSQKSRPK